MEGQPPETDPKEGAGEPTQPEPPGGWLPPQAPGGQPPPPAQAPPQPQAPAPSQPQAPPPPVQSPQQFPPPAYPPPPPPGYPYPYPPQQPAYPPQRYQPLPPQPPNNDAVTGFTCAVIGATLLFFTAGLSTIVSLVLGIVAIPYSRKGKRAVAEGKTRKHKDLANSGYVIGIITIIVSILATIAWILLFALVDWDEIDDENDDTDDPFTFLRPAIRVAAGLARLLG